MPPLAGLIFVLVGRGRARASGGSTNLFSIKEEVPPENSVTNRVRSDLHIDL